MDIGLLLDIISSFCLILHDSQGTQKIWIVMFVLLLSLLGQLSSSDSRIAYLPEDINGKLVTVLLTTIIVVVFLIFNQTNLECFLNSLWLLSMLKIFAPMPSSPD